MNRPLLIAAAILLIATGSAGAGQRLHPVYADELDRCVSLLRESLAGAGTQELRHIVTEAGTRGSWYEFAIRSEAADAPGGPAVRSVEARCRAHRWSTLTEIAFSRQ